MWITIFSSTFTTFILSPPSLLAGSDVCMGKAGGLRLILATCDSLPPPIFTVTSILRSTADRDNFLTISNSTRWWSPLLPLLRGIQDSPVCRFEEFQGKNWARFWQLGQRWRWQAHLMANSATPMSALWLVERRGEAAPWLVDSGSQQRGFVLLASAQPDIDYGPGRGGVVFKLCQKYNGCSFLIATPPKVEDGKIPTENRESEATFSLLW